MDVPDILYNARTSFYNDFICQQQGCNSINQKAMLSIIILNYRSAEYSRKCVLSIQTQLNHNDYEIIVVDNCSGGNEVETLKCMFSHSTVKIVTCRFNGGFGLGNMIGADCAEGDYLCFINSDVMIEEDCFTPLCAYLDSHPNVGVITPQQYDFNHKRVASFRHNPGILREAFGNSIVEWLRPSTHPKRNVLHSEPVVVDQINGAFMLFRTTDFWKIGGFDTNIYLYDEECDIGYRLRRLLNKQCVVHPHYAFLHKGGATTKKRSRTGTERYISRVYVFRKHHGMFHSWIYKAVLVFFTLMKPKKWHLLPLLIRGEALSRSMRHG